MTTSPVKKILVVMIDSSPHLPLHTAAAETVDFFRLLLHPPPLVYAFAQEKRKPSGLEVNTTSFFSSSSFSPSLLTLHCCAPRTSSLSLVSPSNLQRWLGWGRSAFSPSTVRHTARLRRSPESSPERRRRMDVRYTDERLSDTSEKLEFERLPPQRL